MKKKKKTRILIKLICTFCTTNTFKKIIGLSTYFSTKNRLTFSNRLKLNKYCKYCNKHTTHIEHNYK
jgi:large subunit ribosomal protein L33